MALVEAPLIGPVAAPQLHVMSFNIRRRVKNVNRWSHDHWSRREPLMRKLLAAEQPTVLGVQEALPDQLPAVLGGLGANYRSIGDGRNADGGGELCPVVYNDERLELIDWEQQALSDTPRKAGSTGWGNFVPRIVVVARFQDRATRNEFTVLNAHLDHRSRKSRQRSMVAIREIVLETDGPVVVVGDFNTGVESQPYRTLTGGGLLTDSWITAERRISDLWGTFPHYREPRRGTKRIDWILANAGVDVLETGINVTRYNGDWPSDHAPVQALITL